MSALFISDLHLEAGKPELTQILLRFLRERAPSAKALYLLGDIFEVWIGDDANDPLMGVVADALMKLAQSGTQVFFLHGNRDFLLRQAYADRAGMVLLEDPTVRTIGGIPTLLTHGDRYCTDDAAYQAFRTRSRDPAWQAKVLGWPLWRRRLTARLARYLSKRNYRKKVKATGNANQIADVVVVDVERELDAQGVKRVIHGHTHRPGEHTHALDSGVAERIVLADWRESGEALEVRDDGTFGRHVLTA